MTDISLKGTVVNWHAHLLMERRRLLEITMKVPLMLKNESDKYKHSWFLCYNRLEVRTAC